jgi:hypothetical protein
MVFFLAHVQRATALQCQRPERSRVRWREEAETRGRVEHAEEIAVADGNGRDDCPWLEATVDVASKDDCFRLRIL